MAETRPKVTVGLPVYNGENYLVAAIESALSERFDDFELIISDNASTDGTEEICRQYADSDPRVRYFRQRKNLGAAPNYNFTFHRARGKYFRWLSHDDLSHPEFLEAAVPVLDARPEVVLCHSTIGQVDENGNEIEEQPYHLRTASSRVLDRFWDLLFVRNTCAEVFGLTRSSVLATTGLHGAFPVGDRVLLSELAFRGRFHKIDAALFFIREHNARSVRQFVSQQERAAWFDARYTGRITFPEWRTLAEYLKAIRRAPLEPRDRLFAYAYMAKYVRHYRKRMRSDLWVALNRALHLG